MTLGKILLIVEAILIASMLIGLILFMEDVWIKSRDPQASLLFLTSIMDWSYFQLTLTVATVTTVVLGIFLFVWSATLKPKANATTGVPVHIQQIEPVNSPNIIGNHNVVTFGETEPLPQRTLSAEQKAKILAVLQNASPSTILLLRWDSKESQLYLQEFVGVLKQAHWQMKNLLLGERPEPTEKIRLGWMGTSTNPEFQVLSSALKNAGLEFESSCFSSDAGPSVMLDVGVGLASDKQKVFDRIQ